MIAARTAGVALVAATAAAGCAKPNDRLVLRQVEAGEYGQAREALSGRLDENRTSRGFLYERMMLGLVCLADGLPAAAEPTFDEIYETLRTQGINADKTVASVVLNERIKFWKGEPFEQALLFVYVAIQKAMMNEWDNARAAAANSLFLLKDFGSDPSGLSKTTEQIARDAVAHEQDPSPKKPRKTKKQGNQGEDYLDEGYEAAETTFVLGYLMSGVANAVLGREGDPDRVKEADEQFDKAAQIAERMHRREQEDLRAIRRGLGELRGPDADEAAARRAADGREASLSQERVLESAAGDIAALVKRLKSGRFNTIFIVDYGLGPTKEAYGMDGAFSRFVQRCGWTGREPLSAAVDDRPPLSVPAACDLNAMARDHRWNNMEDVRRAKSYLGTALLAAGAGVAASGRDEYGVGAGMMLMGMAMKASARADTRHCLILPQRVYLVPLNISRPRSTVTLQVGQDAASRMVLPGIDPPTGPSRVQLRYVRLTPTRLPADWATGGRILYANDQHGGRVAGDDLPFILGGRCVRLPTSEVLSHYQQAGRLMDLTLADLQNLYREEGIELEPQSAGGLPGRHVLEGGDSLVSPLAGTAGFVRLFCREHAPRRPRSAAVRTLMKRVREERAALAGRGQDH